MVLYKQGTKLFNGVRDLVAAHLDEQANSKIQPNFPIMTSTSTTANAATTATQLSDPQTPHTMSGKGKGKATEPDEMMVERDLATPVTETHQIGLISGNAGDRLTVIQSQERLLKSVREVWDDHVACMKKLRDVLKYMVGPVSYPRLASYCLQSRFFNSSSTLSTGQSLHCCSRKYLRLDAPCLGLRAVLVPDSRHSIAHTCHIFVPH